MGVSIIIDLVCCLFVFVALWVNELWLVEIYSSGFYTGPYLLTITQKVSVIDSVCWIIIYSFISHCPAGSLLLMVCVNQLIYIHICLPMCVLKASDWSEFYQLFHMTRLLLLVLFFNSFRCLLLNIPSSVDWSVGWSVETM